MNKSKAQSPATNQMRSKKSAKKIQSKKGAKQDSSAGKKAGNGGYFDPIKVGLIVLFAAIVGIGTGAYLTHTETTETTSQSHEEMRIEEGAANSNLPEEEAGSDQE
jgi:hypothetical protein